MKAWSLQAMPTNCPKTGGTIKIISGQEDADVNICLRPSSEPPLSILNYSSRANFQASSVLNFLIFNNWVLNIHAILLEILEDGH